MNIHNTRFITSVFDIKNAPERLLPEVVFAGRSNVGKSSMINALVNRKSFARVSSVPGKTASINYYLIDDKLYLVDLPGYGYARVSDSEKQRWSWLIEGYFNSPREITLIFLLIDVRHKPSAQDMMMKEFLLEARLPFVFVLTKCDKLSPGRLEKRIAELVDELKIPDREYMLPFSAVSGLGKQELLKLLEECAGYENRQI